MSSVNKSPLNLILGVQSVGDTSADPMARFYTPEEVNGFLDIFLQRGYNHLDTSRMYSPNAPGSSEARLGAAGAGERFIIDTKVMSWAFKHTTDNVLSEIDASLEALKVKQINTEFLHIPDRTTPFEEACVAMDQAVKEGKVKKWGLSNYTAGEVRQFLDICEARGLVKPSVYEGPYNPIMRGGEKELFPILRENGIDFNAYSPAASGFFAGNHKTARPGGRFDESLPAGAAWSMIYKKPSIVAAADKAVAVASKHGVSGHAAALRWTVYHGILSKEHGDSVIVGASSREQLEANLDIIEQGPLPQEVVLALDAVHEEIGSEVSYHM
ncbi:aflatoxin B1 aldehyde reductase member 2 [Colletotrichum higginsianum]|uniref:Aflatoxin B1 aldehyde reductase member 2 n=1 Tax=Colletotrichum higginsianum (strain IMI 349063) TaxID=759273 RepID=H1V7L7_COLHI|nr:Aflatoxin B1 aldehyde reductase member 2 [Colletotrichum higginsianum IMI 349063]OBR09524.1 Aflatoxin B1 aldehyde reductase member 2 [Colletotrichum higginsianum IMI 349063]CCF36219.1 aflatoxin B1 aldehyde reductase member 2 [Colletotrichum higginsianum]